MARAGAIANGRWREQEPERGKNETRRCRPNFAGTRRKSGIFDDGIYEAFRSQVECRVKQEECRDDGQGESERTRASQSARRLTVSQAWLGPSPGPEFGSEMAVPPNPSPVILPGDPNVPVPTAPVPPPIVNGYQDVESRMPALGQEHDVVQTAAADPLAVPLWFQEGAQWLRGAISQEMGTFLRTEIHPYLRQLLNRGQGMGNDMPFNIC
ncbi:hypothetical protein EDB84DRAFT_1446959 [Lactarius hengduanensis]|nr:hypothetical protein EDB84DRAFT_1446959 [Lactarius hengduanensis]